MEQRDSEQLLADVRNKIVLMDPSSVSLKQDIRIYGWYLDISVPWSLG